MHESAKNKFSVRSDIIRRLQDESQDLRRRVFILEYEEWADPVGQTELGRAMDTQINALLNEITMLKDKLKDRD